MNTFLRKTIIPGLNESDFNNPKEISEIIIENLLKSNEKIKILLKFYANFFVRIISLFIYYFNWNTT